MTDMVTHMFPEDEGENGCRQLCQEYNEDQHEELQREEDCVTQSVFGSSPSYKRSCRLMNI